MTFQPAPRFVHAQAWWIASELCRRNSSLRVLEAWPLDGFYHGLEVGQKLNADHIFMNYLGSIHLFPKGSESEGSSKLAWEMAYRAESPHEMVKQIETTMSWSTHGAEPANPRSLVYRVIARILSAEINDRAQWTVGSTYGPDQQFAEWPEILSEYEGCRLALQNDTATETPASSRVWVVKRDRSDVLLLSDLGFAFFRASAPVDLMKIYKKRRRLDDVVASLF